MRSNLAKLAMDGRGGPDAMRGGGFRGGRGGFSPNMLRTLDRDGDGRLECAEIEMVFTDLDVDRSGVIEAGELGPAMITSLRAPQQGDVAPDFELPFARTKPGRCG